jgi:hypothetical protein
MASWTIHLPPGDGLDIPDTERFILVKDGLRPFAVLFGPFWFLAKRLWWGALGVLVVEAAVFALAWFAPMPRPAPALIQALFNILLGLEASTIQRWTLRRHGWREAGALVAHGRDEAETRAAEIVGGLIDADPPAAPPRGPSMAYPLASAPVLGLFPEARTR